VSRLGRYFRRKFRGISFFRDINGSSNEPILEDKITPLAGDFGKQENLQEVWKLDREDEYLHRPRRIQWARILFPVLIFFLIIALLFWILPTILPMLLTEEERSVMVLDEPQRVYNSEYRRVDEYVTNLLEKPDVKSLRLTQLLYNEPVRLYDGIEKNGYLLVQSVDNLIGYIRVEDLSEDMDPIEPYLHPFRLVVSDVSKNIMSHPSNGTLEIEVMMNTVLYSDQKRDGVYHVALPDGKSGWVSSSGVIELGVIDQIEKVSTRYFVSSVLSFVNSTYLENGISRKGLSTEGLAFVAASVNGVKLPRTMSGLMESGEEIELRYDKVTGDLLIDSIEAGDLVFLSHPTDPSVKNYEMAICTDSGVLLMISQSRTTLRLQTFSNNEKLISRITSVRRVF